MEDTVGRVVEVAVMRWFLASMFITLHMLGFPFAAFGCLLGGAFLTLTNLQRLPS